jgi:hypothetical protein
MATTSIWAVKSRVDHVIDYATNEQKTDRRWSEGDLQTMRDVMDYAMNDAKTEKQFYITGLQCNLRDARSEMALVKRRFGKENGILAFHGYQSFKPGEVTPDVAHEIGVKLAEELWPDHQVIVATHLDKTHIHNHFVLNSVSMRGMKFHSNKETYRQMRAASDRLCKEYGLSVIEDQKAYFPKHYAEWAAEQNGQPTWRSSIRVDIDSAVKEAMTFQQFVSEMKKKGYVLERRGSFLRIKAPGMQRFVRLRSLGEGYLESDIRRRILQKRYPSLPKKKQTPPAKKGVIRGDFRLSKITWKGLRALYYFYIRKLREAQRQPRESIPDVLRVDLRNLDAISEQAKFLSRYQLDTGEQVEALKGNLKKKLSELQDKQKALSNEKRRKGITPDRAAELQKQTDQLNAALRQTRKDIKLCDAVLDRSLLIEEKNRVLHEQKQQSAARVQQKTKSDRKYSR